MRANEIRDRITKLVRLTPSQIKPHPLNPRRHPHRQLEALRGSMSEIGFAQACIVYKNASGEYTLIDGAARHVTASDNSKIPCLVLDVTDDETAKLLATMDEIGGLAELDRSDFDKLTRSMTFDSHALNQLLDEIRSEDEASGDDETSKSNGKEIIHEQGVQLEPAREYIVIKMESDTDWEEIKQVLSLRMVRRGGYKPGSPMDHMAIERVIPSSRLIEALKNASRNSK